MVLKFTILTIALTGFCLSACATSNNNGRAAKLTKQVNSWDSKLSCSHLFGEYKNNNERLVELKGERGAKLGQNVALLTFNAALFESAYAGIDFSGSEKKEAKSIISRQTVLLSYMKNKTCPEFDEIEAAKLAAEAEEPS